ncbi:type I-F CRISPR-associated protein Csy2 [Azonexus hydrophilus]|uniref:type I-F CRISPR-associated protein Csy2 n=1 Tax=Azonexus hydrophilus TaxID=418702 RepID=UPI00248FEE9F|nr:type I-F CRISPR-associated protein Csy2 [Azonexus hydrophilus]
MSDVFALVLLPYLKVQNANAISGPLTWGFPSPTAFAGFAHALERKFATELDEGFAGVGIICHHFEPQVFQPPGRRTQVFRLTRNPVGKDGGTLALVEEGRVHMEVSLVIAVRDYKSEGDGKDLAERLHHAAQGMRLAGGSLLHQEGRRYQAQWWPLAGDVEGDARIFRRLRRRLLPGFALVQRDDLLVGHLAEMRATQPESNALDALLDLSRLNIEPVVSQADEADVPVKWEIRRKPGWLVPLPIGYAGISPLYAPGEVENARDAATLFRFVESFYSLGEWVSPHRLNDLSQLLWTQETDAANGIYRCINRYSESLANFKEQQNG